MARKYHSIVIGDICSDVNEFVRRANKVEETVPEKDRRYWFTLPHGWTLVNCQSTSALNPYLTIPVQS